MSGVYDLLFTTLPSTSTQAWALKGMCCARMTIWGGTPYGFKRHAAAAERCKQSASFQYQIQAMSTAAQIRSTAWGDGTLFATGYLRTSLYSAAKFPRARYRSN